MRIGVTLPSVDEEGRLLDGEAFAAVAQRVEDAGLDGVWRGDHLPVPGVDVRTRPDSLMSLLLAAYATNDIEVGTCIYGVPLRSMVEVAQRFATLHTFAPGRFTFGVGTGSQASEYEAAGLEWEERFSRLEAHMEGIRAFFDAGAAAEDGPSPTPGRPRFVLGAWHSEAQLRRAANEYDGWMASGGGFNQRRLRGPRPVTPGEGRSLSARFGDWKTLRTTVERYRELGGRRVMMSTVPLDLEMAATPMTDEGTFNLQCPPEEASARLLFLEELGFDDIIVVPGRQLHLGGGEVHGWGYSAEALDQLRSLLAKDERPYRDSESA